MHMHGTIKGRTGKPRSAITNGSRLFAERLDLRTPRGLRFKDLLAGYTRDAGGDKLTEAQRAIVRDLAMLQCLSEDLQQSYMQTGVMSKEEQTQYSRIGNTMRKHMVTLGLTKSRDTKPDDEDVEDPLEYANRGGSRRTRQRLDDDEGD
jgi:hypothetical protein